MVVAGIFPDVVDKTLCQALHLTSSGRMFGHTLAGLALSTVVVRLVWGRRVAWSWMLGYLGHLLGDVGGFMPWLYPFVRYDFPRQPLGLLEILRRALADPARIGWDLALSAWAACAWCWPWVKRVVWDVRVGVRGASAEKQRSIGAEKEWYRVREPAYAELIQRNREAEAQRRSGTERKSRRTRG